MRTTLMLLYGLGLASPLAFSASGSLSATMMNDLQAAFSGESNAHARYLSFAQKADAEGYHGAASLFRAAARAEEIHAGNHAEVIRSAGGIPRAKLTDP